MPEETRVPTYGEKAVGLAFNPSNDGNVQTIKELYAKIIDLCNDISLAESATNSLTGEKARLLKIAITEAQGAQMWAVKAVTFTN
jgi:hypothetical protein